MQSLHPWESRLHANPAGPSSVGQLLLAIELNVKVADDEFVTPTDPSTIAVGTEVTVGRSGEITSSTVENVAGSDSTPPTVWVTETV